jgi:hypothetical protein
MKSLPNALLPGSVGRNQTRVLERQKHVHDFNDGVWFTIYSYLYFKDSEDEYPTKSSSTLHQLSILIGHVSKNDNNRFIRYIQQVPHNFKVSICRHAGRVLWACRNNMKLGKLDLSNIYFYTQETLSILRSCDLGHLHTLKISLSAFHYGDGTIYHEPTRSIQTNICIPLNQKRTLSLKKLHLCTFKNRFFSPLLTNLSQSLEEFVLETFHCGKVTKSGFYDDDFEIITQAVKSLPMLKKLTIKSTSQVSFRIISSSVEEICTSQSSYGFWVDDCKCPSLRLFESRYCPEDGTRNGVKPACRITIGEARNALSDSGFVDFRVGSRSFVGMLVPASCIVSLLLCP